MQTVILEIRAAEGGAHAKRLVQRQAGIYRALCARKGLVCETVADRL